MQKIKDIEDELARTQKNKATMHHIGLLKAKLAKLRKELLEPKSVGGSGPGGTLSVIFVKEHQLILFSWFRCCKDRCGPCWVYWISVCGEVYADE